MSAAPRRAMIILGWVLGCGLTTAPAAADDAAYEAKRQAAAATFVAEVQPLLTRYCADCHTGETAEAGISLGTLAAFDAAPDYETVWQNVYTAVKQGVMPPPDAEQPSLEERAVLTERIRRFLKIDAARYAGDPGPVVLRRLNNVEYTNTVRALTGITDLDPVREFPPDSAAGEGFTNVGSALAMSPALAEKYYDAAKQVAAHAAFTPSGMRFSPGVSRRDWTDDCLRAIRTLYRRYSVDDAEVLRAAAHPTRYGRLPVDRYLEATLAEREALRSGAASIEGVAKARGLSPKYLRMLWEQLEAPSGSAANPLLADVRARWEGATPEQAADIAARIAAWQRVLWKFNPVGRIGQVGAPTRWEEAVTPIVDRHELRLPLPAPTDPRGAITAYLSATGLSDGATNAVWHRPRLVRAGRADILLRDAWRIDELYRREREGIFAQTAACLQAVDEGSRTPEFSNNALAEKFAVSPVALAAWQEFLGERAESVAPLGDRIAGQIPMISTFNFVKGWLTPEGASVLANSSDETAYTPAMYPPHSIVVHPAPKQRLLVAWRCPADLVIRTSARVQDSHPGCGNGVDWSFELRRGKTRQVLWSGLTNGDKEEKFATPDELRLKKGDAIVLSIGPRDGDHSCDSTWIDVAIESGEQEWDLAREASPDILAENPRRDAFGNSEVWHFATEPTDARAIAPLPAGSLLARWQQAPDGATRRQLEQELNALLTSAAAEPADSVDQKLRAVLVSEDEALLSTLLTHATPAAAVRQGNSEASLGLDLALFGRTPAGAPIDAESLGVAAPQVLEVRLPASLAAGSELVAEGSLEGCDAEAGAVQFQMLAAKPETEAPFPESPFVAAAGSGVRQALEAHCAEFRDLFPTGLCYTQLVPVDEVISTTLYYREDDHLSRLMLDESEHAELDRLWDELFFVSQEPIETYTAYQQLLEYATQIDARRVNNITPMGEKIEGRMAELRAKQTAAEPGQIAAVIDWAGKAYRRPLTASEDESLRRLYATLRAEELEHEEALRLVMARVLASSSFLYRLEKQPEGAPSAPVNNWELASRLSYFLWSSPPDDDLRAAAAVGTLHEPAVLLAQTRRMLQDGRVRNLAEEFGCQWLNIHAFDRLDEKSERHFPTFAALRGPMYEEAIQFFADLFQNDRSVLALIDADYAILNEELAKHYGIPGVTGPEWRRVDGVKQYGRGGILALGATLAKQSGASRTSPILRGNWLTGVVLDDKLPPPPKNVPPLDDEIPAGLTERQITERHARDPACMSCHAKIDPFGFALEHYDAIGRKRDVDAAGLAIDSVTTLPDGTALGSLDDLRTYLLEKRRDEVVRQFTRKLLGYALGRATQMSDEPLLDEINAALQANGYKSTTAVELIVTSRQFREIGGVSVTPPAEQRTIETVSETTTEIPPGSE